MVQDVSVIMPAKDVAGTIERAVQSVLDHAHDGHAVTVHLVENASPGDDAAQLAATHEARGWGDRVVIYQETENHGFGRGNNVGLEALAASGVSRIGWKKSR